MAPLDTEASVVAELAKTFRVGEGMNVIFDKTAEEHSVKYA